MNSVNFNTHLQVSFAKRNFVKMTNVTIEEKVKQQGDLVRKLKSQKAEKEKIQKYQELANKYIVMPVAVETMGAWGQSSLKFVQEIGDRITVASGDKLATYKLLQNISLEIQRGNIASILGTLPSPRSITNQIFYL